MLFRSLCIMFPSHDIDHPTTDQQNDQFHTHEYQPNQPTLQNTLHLIHHHNNNNPHPTTLHNPTTVQHNAQHQPQHIHLTEHLQLALTTQTHPTTHLPQQRIAKKHTTNPPTHNQETNELQHNIAHIKQFLTLLNQHDLRYNKYLHNNHQKTRCTKTALHHNHHLTILNYTQKHLTNHLTLTQHLNLKTNKNIQHHQPNENNNQRTHHTYEALSTLQHTETPI